MREMYSGSRALAMLSEKGVFWSSETHRALQLGYKKVRVAADKHTKNSVMYLEVMVQ
jgi:hypothetical protein